MYTNSTYYLIVLNFLIYSWNTLLSMKMQEKTFTISSQYDINASSVHFPHLQITQISHPHGSNLVQLSAVWDLLFPNHSNGDKDYIIMSELWCKNPLCISHFTKLTNLQYRCTVLIVQWLYIEWTENRRRHLKTWHLDKSLLIIQQSRASKLS